MNYCDFKECFDIQLNNQQEAAVKKVDGSVLLLAVPGSGKTTVLISRLGYMIYCCNIRPENILTVTYTVAATNDMRKRFEEKFGREFSSRLEFRTINGISQKILQYFGKLIGKPVFNVAQKEAASIIKMVFFDITNQYPTENDLKSIQTAITYVKNMRLSTEEIKTFETDIKQFEEIYKQYNKELRNRRLIDYDDQMVYALKILEQYPEVLKYFQEQFQYVCVDEAQDTSKIQHDIIQLLSANSNNLFMVGDEDQSIYGFRAAYPEALVHFEQKHVSSEILLMETNYRSCRKIVGLADQLIQENCNRHKKKMVAARTTDGNVKQIGVRSRKEQYQYLLKVAQNCKRETAVLYRNNESALPIIDLLERHDIKYRIKRNDISFFSHPVVCDICDYMKFALEPYNGEIFFRIYYKMGAGISKELANYAVNHSQGRNGLLALISEEMEVSSFVRRQCRTLLKQFEYVLEEDAGKAVYRILNCMGYREYVNDHGMDYGKAEILQILGKQETSIKRFLKRLEELSEIIAEGSEDVESCFILSTIHSSKGLEYDRVYMTDMLDGIIPSCNKPGKNASLEEKNEYEEERRLYYVGMTRAKNDLNIFTFDENATSEFSKIIFKNRFAFNQQIYNTSLNNYKLSDSKIDLSGYDTGVLVVHNKYGRGVVVNRNENQLEVLFDQDNETRKIMLSFAIQNKIIRLDDEN